MSKRWGAVSKAFVADSEEQLTPVDVLSGSPTAVCGTHLGPGVPRGAFFHEKEAGTRDFVQEPVGVVAAADVTEPQLVTLGAGFTLFYIAPDEDGVPQVFAGEIPCAQ